MNHGLCELFDIINGEGERPVNDTRDVPADDFWLGEAKSWPLPDLAFAAGAYFHPSAGTLFELSVDAFHTIVHAWMSEFPIDAEIIRFGRKILAAGERKAAEMAVTDRGDPDVRVVLDAAYKVQREIHRLQGFFRFIPDEEGVYIARCEPDHLILPALGDYFNRRFGDTPWAIIDEKRRLCLSCPTGEQPALMRLPESARPQAASDEWEYLWRLYHKTISNSNRYNPALQDKFIPKRYRKYLPEL